MGSFRENPFTRRRNLKKIDFGADLGSRFFADFPRFLQIIAAPGRAQHSQCPKIVWHILEHAGQLPDKFQADRCRRSRVIVCEKSKNFPPRVASATVDPDFDANFVDFRGISPVNPSFRARKATPSHQKMFAHTRACGTTPTQISGGLAG